MTDRPGDTIGEGERGFRVEVPLDDPLAVALSPETMERLARVERDWAAAAFAARNILVGARTASSTREGL